MVTKIALFFISPAGFQVSRLKKELLVCCEERDSAQLERDLLNNRFKHLETELESERSTHTERTREARGLEVRLGFSSTESGTEEPTIKCGDGQSQTPRAVFPILQVDKAFTWSSASLGKSSVCLVEHKTRLEDWICPPLI